MNPGPAASAPLARLPRTLSAAARWLLWLVLAVWMMLALTMGALHLWIVPRINDWRPALERWATQAVGVPVQVGAIRVHTDAPAGQRRVFLPSLFPALELQNVRLLDPQGRQALQLPSVQAAVSPGSLWRLGFEQIVIDAPVLEVRRTPQGRIEIAGLDLFGESTGDGGAADWLFSQGEFAIRRGTVRWTDELRQQPPLALSDLDFVLRNSRRTHEARLDATPPADWGARWSLRAQMREPLLDLLHLGADPRPWERWSGELYADFPEVDVARLRQHLPGAEAWGEVRSGQGRLRAWADVVRGQITGATADLALTDLASRWRPRLPELVLSEVSGRLSARWDAEGFEVVSQGLRLRTPQGLDWDAGQGRLQHRQARGAAPAATEAQLDRLDLDTLATLAARLPLPPAVLQGLADWRPSGRVEGLNLRFEGLPPALDPEHSPPVAAAAQTAPGAPTAQAAAWWPARYRASARVAGLSLQAAPAALSPGASHPPLGRPGVEGLSGTLELHQDGGHASLGVADGALDLPGVFERSRIPLQRLSAEARWRVAGERIDVWLDRFNLANAEAEGSGSAHWHTSDPASGPSRARFPGVLDLNARLTRGEARQVHHYLPLAIGDDARRYVREAVGAGSVGPVDFRIRGDLWDLPYNLPGTQGEFRIASTLRGVDFRYVPAFLQAPEDRAWPSLQAVNAQLVLERAALSVSGLEAGLNGMPGLRLRQGEVSIPDLMDPVVQASAQVQGPGTELLGFVQRSPVNDLTSQALDRATLSGPAQGRFALRLPLFALDNSTVQGSVQLAGNDVQISPESPLLARASGEVAFSERGFTVSQARAQMFGGELRFEGGMSASPQGPARIRFRGEGTASAEGLQQGGLGLASTLFGQARGFAAYSAELGFRAGVPELSVTSQLQGMALDLPAPLNKAAGDRLPLRYDNHVLSVLADAGGEVPRTDRLAIALGPTDKPLARFDYERELTASEPRVLRGSIGIGLTGEESVVMPARGVQANARFTQLDVDAWQQLLTQRLGAPAGTAATTTEPAGLDYLPNQLGLRATQLKVGGRHFNDLVIGGAREGSLWRANLDADELNGYIEYRQPVGNAAGSVFARLAHLDLAPTVAADVEQLLQQPSSMPALDIAVQDFVLSGLRLGRVEVQAQNRGAPGRSREWRLTQLVVDVPEAQLEATGNWAFANNRQSDARRTALSFTLAIQDAGLLLRRFGKPDTVRGGRGQITGQIGWVGSPMGLDTPSLSGALQADVQRGQFLKADPGAAKLLGVLSLQALPRRLALDFRDVFSEGFAFDFVRGDARIERGILRTNNLQMKGINAAVLMEGSADLVGETQDLQVVVVPELNAGTASLIATAINPAIGLGTFLAQFILRDPLQTAATQTFRVSGGWADPLVEKIERTPPPATAAPAAPSPAAPTPTVLPPAAAAPAADRSAPTKDPS